MNKINGITITYSRSSESGNIFWIVGELLVKYRNCGVKFDDFEVSVINRIKACHSYEEALNVVREYADLIEEE